MLPNRRLAAALAAGLLACAGCGSADDAGPPASGSSAPTGGTAALRSLCQPVHVAVDALVTSSRDSQRLFAAEMHRFSDAADASTRTALAPLVTAAEDLEAAGLGDGFYAARDGIHTAVVALNSDCTAVDSPILHAGPHS